MKIDDFMKQISNTIETAEKDGDGFMVIHFSKQENKYFGKHANIDGADALIIVRDLIKLFGLSPKIISEIN